MSIDYPKYCVELPRVIVTPTRTLVSGFDIETSNRVVREFMRRGYAVEDFLRVTFCEENGGRLMNDDFKSDQICKRIKALLLKGLNINGNQYMFLAYSSSQLKESSVWMVNCSESSLVEKIRKWMGDFSSIKIPSKYAARMGQCFSTTFATLDGVTTSSTSEQSWSRMFNRSMNVQPHTDSNHLRINDSTPDIFSQTSSDKLSCHSDGTGVIRRDALKKLLEKVPSVSDPEAVSVIQIRIGGAKGTLTAWDDVIPTLRSNDVCLRPSMVKFPASYKNLEVIKVGKHVPYYLNRQMIMLLGVHNVHTSTFLEMQSTMLKDLDRMLICKNKAYDNLIHLSGLDSGIQSQLLHMLEMGFCPKSEPFLFSCLHALRAQHLLNLKKKARIFVKNGAVLIGK